MIGVVAGTPVKGTCRLLMMTVQTITFIYHFIFSSTCNGVTSVGFYNRKVTYLWLFCAAEEEAEAVKSEVAQPLHMEAGDQPCEPLSVVSLSLIGDLKDKPPPFPPSSGAVCLTSWPSSPF